MPMKQTFESHRRWLNHGSAVHAIYETDDGHHRTLCGQLLQGGALFVAHPKQVKRACPMCRARIRVRNYVCREE